MPPAFPSQLLAETADALASCLLTGPEKQERARALAAKLLTLAGEHPDFERDLLRAVKNIYKTANRTFAGDVLQVRRCVEQGCTKVKEIREETGLPREDVQAALDYLINTGDCTLRPRPTLSASGTREMLYVLSDSPGGDCYLSPSPYSLPAYVSA